MPKPIRQPSFLLAKTEPPRDLVFFCPNLVSQRESKELSQVDLPLDRQPIEVDLEMVLRMQSFGAALGLCQTIGGVTDQEVCAELDIDAGVWSRIKRTGDPRYHGQRGHFPHDKLVRFMELCGNDVPVLWLLHARNLDPRSVRRYRSDVEAENERLREKLAAMEQRLEIIGEWEQRKKGRT